MRRSAASTSPASIASAIRLWAVDVLRGLLQRVGAVAVPARGAAQDVDEQPHRRVVGELGDEQMEVVGREVVVGAAESRPVRIVSTSLSRKARMR